MADIHFGAGQAITSLNAALTAASDGDKIISHGPHLDTVLTTIWTKNDIVWNHRGGTYTFNGGAVTLDCLKIDGTGNTLNLLNANGRVKFSRYGRFVFWVNAAGNVINDPYLISNGYPAAGNCYNYMLYADSTINRPIIASASDNNARQYGLFVNGCAGGKVTDLDMSNIVVTGGASRVYGVASSAACGEVLIDGVTISGCSSGQISYGLLWGGTGAGDVMKVRRADVSGLTSAGVTYVSYVINVAMDLENFIIYDCDGTGIYIVSAAFAGGTHRAINGVAYGMAVDGLRTTSTAVGSQLTIRNVIARNCTGYGFRSTGVIDPDSNNNLAFGNGTDYNGWTKGALDIENVRPLHTNAAAGDFTLLADSPCIDAGATIAGRTTDFAGDPISGSGTDIGPFEYQWSFPRYDEGYDLLPSLYKEATYFVQMIQALSGKITPKNSIEELEVVGQSLNTDMWIANASGIQLDILGAIVGQQRCGMTDTNYRLRIAIKAAINTSSGLIEQIYDSVIGMFSPQWVHILTSYPEDTITTIHQTSHMFVVIRTASGAAAIPDNITDTMQPIAAGGVSMWIVSAEDDVPFGWDDDTTADGFDEIDGAGVREGIGGTFADIYPHRYNEVIAWYLAYPGPPTIPFPYEV